MGKIGVFIPCYNVEKTITQVFNSFSDDILGQIDEILVIDNVSRDKTLAILNGIQSTNKFSSKLHIIKNQENQGLGGSQKIAYQYFIDHQFTHFMIIHGDDQGDNNAIIRSFLSAFKKNPNIDLILASRFHPQANTSRYNLLRRIGNHFFNGMTFLLTGHHMSDAGTGIMFIRTEVLKKIPFSSLTNSFQFNPQLNILLYDIKGLQKEEVPLNWKDSEAGSNIRSLEYCWTLLRILIRYRINRSFFRRPKSQLFDQN